MSKIWNYSIKFIIWKKMQQNLKFLLKFRFQNIQYTYPNAKYPESYSITLTIADNYNLVIEDDGTWWIYEEEKEEEE